ncbi:MAG: excinuclease ABC subunit A, partial [Planctomycetota bacterium]
DGRRWHTELRTSRSGEEVRWDGRALAAVVDYIDATDRFSPVDWNSQTIVEIRAKKKSAGWFFHAITGERWLLKMKFRTARNTFVAKELIEQLDLKPLNEMPDLPLYGREPRTHVTNRSGPWQEIELRVHSFDEIDHPEFWAFLDRAMDGFLRVVEKAETNPQDLLPWKALGKKWHTLDRGFPPGTSRRWNPELLDRLCELLLQVVPNSRIGWKNKVTVPFVHPDTGTAWAILHTKRPNALRLVLPVPKNRITQGRILSIGRSPSIDGSRDDVDHVRLRFRTPADLKPTELLELLKECAAAQADRPDRKT